MFGWSKPSPQKATSGRLEIERDGHIAYLEYTLAGKVLQLIHSEVPEAMRGKGHRFRAGAHGAGMGA